MACCRAEQITRATAIETAGVDDYEAMSALAKKTFVMITTVGPYSVHGEHAVKACVEAGTHYFDVTGETPWVYKMIKKYEKAAKESGAILIPQMGLESAPADLCTWSLANTLRKQMDVKTKDVIISIHNIRLVEFLLASSHGAVAYARILKALYSERLPLEEPFLLFSLYSITSP